MIRQDTNLPSVQINREEQNNLCRWCGDLPGIPNKLFYKTGRFWTVSCWILILKYFDITKKVDLIIHTLYCENIIQNIRKYTERWSTYPSDFSDWIRAVKNNLVTWIIPIHLGSKKKVSANHLPREMVLSNVIDYRRVINDTTIKQLCVVTPNREMLPRFKEDIWSRETEFANFYIKEIWITNNQEIHPLINLMLGAY